MVLILYAAAAWSMALGSRRALALSRSPSTLGDVDGVADWVSAASLICAGLWAWQTRSWLALLAGYALGWAILWMLPLAPSTTSRRTA